MQGCANNEKLGMVAGKYYYNRLVMKMFEDDPDVFVNELEDCGDSFDIIVGDCRKARMINMFLGGQHEEGVCINVILRPEVDPASIPDCRDCGSVWDDMFRGNPNFVKTITVKAALGNDVTVVVFAPVIVQIGCDDAFNPDGLKSMTYEQMVDRISSCRVPGVVFTTAKK